jgi:uncharacterized protein
LSIPGLDFLDKGAPLLVLEQLDHLPARKRREIARVMQIIFDEFDEAQKTKLSDKAKRGRILKVVLFGSYARGNWVEDHKGGYYSDFDLLVVVNSQNVAEDFEAWERANERFLQDQTITGHIATPVNVIVHTLQEVNDQLAHGRPFFVDIARDGIALYEAEGFPLASPKPLSEEEVQKEAKRHFDQWFPNSIEFQAGAAFYRDRGNLNLAAFELHQATERLYHCVLLVVTLYSPKLHRLEKLRSKAEGIDARLIEAWPRDTKFARRSFTRLDRAYVDARYSEHYEITAEELGWLVERIKVLQTIVKEVCEERLKVNG